MASNSTNEARRFMVRLSWRFRTRDLPLRLAGPQVPAAMAPANLTVLGHPLIRHKLTLLRDKRTPTKDFRELVSEIAMLMAYEVTKDLSTEPVELDTPLERMRGEKVS